MNQATLSTMTRVQLEDSAGVYDIDHTGMDDTALRQAILDAENGVDTSVEDEFEAGMAQELAQREAVKLVADGFIVESAHPMVAGVAPAKKARAASGSSNGLKIEKDREERNGVKRPSAGGKCRAVWDMLDGIGPQATAKEARTQAAEQGFDKTTTMVQFYRWRKFNGEGKQ